MVSYTQAWLDTGGPVRSLPVAIFGWGAEQERLRIGDRTKAGLDRARRRGARLGRPRVALDLNRLLALRAKGISMSKIAAEVGVSVGKVHEVLTGVQKRSFAKPVPIGDPQMADVFEGAEEHVF